MAHFSRLHAESLKHLYISFCVIVIYLTFFFKKSFFFFSLVRELNWKGAGKELEKGREH